jgi:hypothetical protein
MEDACPICGFGGVGVTHRRCVEQAVSLVGRLMLRWGGGCEGDPYREVGPWVREAEAAAYAAWDAFLDQRRPPHEPKL